MNRIEADYRDALRGVMWEDKWRGTLEEYTPRTVEAAEADRRARRWLGVIKPEPVQTTGWPTNRVGLGTYGWTYNPAIIEEAIALEAGIIDTAEGYGFGRVETSLGNTLKHGRRGTWIASKLARNHSSYHAALNAGRRSRDRLQVEQIDLYQIHWPVIDKLGETLKALGRLREEGVIGRIGVCNFCCGQLVEAIRLARQYGFEIESNQIRLNSGDRSATERLLPFCQSIGVRVIAYSPLGQGTLAPHSADSLRWVLSQGAYPIPRTNDLMHLRKNLLVGLDKAAESGDPLQK